MERGSLSQRAAFRVLGDVIAWGPADAGFAHEATG